MCKLIGYYLNNVNSSLKSLARNSDKLEKIIPTGIAVKSDGSLIKSYTQNDFSIINQYISRNNIFPLIQNYNLKSSVSNKFISNPKQWQKTFKKLQKILGLQDYQGINVDLEGIKKENKLKFNNFIKKLSNYLYTNHFGLGLSIPAKTEPNSSSWGAAYDYYELGKLADEIIIMAYDYHWAGGSPGAIAPLNWVQDVLDYAIMKIPPQKIYLGIPCYGYDWVINHPQQPAEGLSYVQIKQIMNDLSVPMEWDQESKTPYLKYEDEQGQHEVWYENKDSICEKIDLVKKFELAGAAFWRLGLEDPELWRQLY